MQGEVVHLGVEQEEVLALVEVALEVDVVDLVELHRDHLRE
jgi:hypothetical protein